MKSKLGIFFICIVLLLVAMIMFFIIKNTLNNTKTNDISKEIGNSINEVIIENGKIKNEKLIDDFIEKAVYSNNENQELNIIQDNVKMQLKYTFGEYAKATNAADKENILVPTGDGSFADNKRIYGYYSLTVNNELKGEYPLVSHKIQRVLEGEKVVLYFDAPLIEYITRPEICMYSLESSNYNKKYDLTYEQRKDLGIKDIFDTGEYLIRTFGGDVTIIIKNATYTLEDALIQNVITPEDIMNQAKMDLKYGVCLQGFYSDGGSTEYCYYGNGNNQYTILKLNTLDGDKDLIIGMGGHIINTYNKNK